MAGSELREISMSEVRKHNTDKSLWMVIDYNVYDVTKYLSEHPGGEDSLMEGAGIDATEPFEDVGHSVDARAIMKKFLIGTIPEAERNQKSTDKVLYLKIGIATLLVALVTGVLLKKTLGR